jgi:hypothetical protein
MGAENWTENWTNSKMAQDFLNSGNPKLETAGSRWAAIHGYQAKTAATEGAVKWGSAR